jgi:hypothetical protein
MATPKEYAYYLKGNKLAIVEKDTAFDNDPNSRDYSPGIESRQWKSPITSVEEALQIEYTYSPTYNNFAQPNINQNLFHMVGWTVRDGYLTFLRNEIHNGVTNFQSSPYNAVTTGSAGGSNDYILVKNSGRWNGVHKIQAAGTEGDLKTYTRVNETLPYFEDVDVDMNTDEEIFDGGGSDNLLLADHFHAGDYIFISGVSGVGPLTLNNGLFYISETTESNTDTASKLKVSKLFGIGKPGASTNRDFDAIYEIEPTLNSVSGQSAINIYKAYKDHCQVYTDITVMEDESFELDVPNYLAKAIVYYLKARLLEDSLELEGHEYYMQKFRRQLEKDASNKSGKHKQVQGFWGLR